MTPQNRTNLAPIPSPSENQASACSQLPSPNGPRKLGERLKTQDGNIKFHEMWQGGHWATNWNASSIPNRLIVGPSSARGFSSVVATEEIESTSVREYIATMPMVPTLVPPQAVDGVATPTKEGTPPPTAGDPSEFPAKAIETKPQPETRKSRNERKLETQVRALRLQIEHIQKRSKETLKHWIALEKDIHDILDLDGSTRNAPPHKVKAKVPSGRPLDPIPNEGSVFVHTKKQSLETTVITLDANVPKSAVELREAPTADVLFEHLICTPEPDSPHTPLRYQIDERLMIKKQLLKDGGVNKFWSHQLYTHGGNPVKVHYCKTFEESEDIAKLFLNNRVIGFDMEWMPFAPATGSKSPR